MNLAEANIHPETQPRHICVFGSPKSGKTELVGSLAKIKKLWWLDLEHGINTLLRADSVANPYLKNIEYFSIPDHPNFAVGVETVLKVLKGGKGGSICHEHGVYCCADKLCKDPGKTSAIDTLTFTPNDVLVIDSYSQLVESTVNHIMRKDIKAENWDAFPGWDEYKKEGNILATIGGRIQTAPFNVAVITHEDMIKMEDGSTNKMVPIGGTTNKSRTFAKYFDDVVYTEYDGVGYKAYCSASEKRNAIVGSRTGKKLIEVSSDGKSKKQLGLDVFFS